MLPLTDSRKRWLTFIIVTVPSLFCVLLLIFVKFIVIPRVVTELLKLRQYSDGSLSLITRHWANYPADMIYKMYVWNITNPDEVIYEGAVPRLQESGPYTWIGHERKENLSFSDDGKEVSYRNLRYWHYSSELSCPTCKDTDRFINPNSVYEGLSFLGDGKDVHPFALGFIDVTTLITGSGPFRSVSAGELLLYSYNDPVVALKDSKLVEVMVKMLGGSIFGINLPEQPKAAGILPHYNNSYEPEFRVQTGKDNIDNLAKIISHGGQESTDWDIGQDIQDCNEGALNKPFREQEDKAFEMDFHEKGSFETIPTYVYRINRDEYDTNSEKHRSMRYENLEGKDYFPTWPACPKDHAYNSNNTQCAEVDCSREANLCDDCCDGSHFNGTFLTSPGFYAMRVFPGRLYKVPAPVFVSPPHMLWAPKEVSSIYAGQSPDEVKHRPIEWTVNPTLGVAVHAAANVQLNLPLWKGALTQSSSLPNALAPICWLNLEVQMHDDIKFLVKLGGLYIPYLINFGIFALLLIAFISVSVIALDKITRLIGNEKPEPQIRLQIRIPAQIGRGIRVHPV